MTKHSTAGAVRTVTFSEQPCVAPLALVVVAPPLLFLGSTRVKGITDREV